MGEMADWTIEQGESLLFGNFPESAELEYAGSPIRYSPRRGKRRRHKKLPKPPIPTCPVCWEKAEQQNTQYGTRSFCCGMWSWDNAPLAGPNTHKARQAAHEAFDTLWKDELCSRTEAYRLLAEELGIPGEMAHMKRMNTEQANKVPEAVARIKTRLNRQQRRFV